MLFTSYEFLLFLLIVFTVYYLIPKKWQWKFLLLASYVFYFTAGKTYLLYIGATTITTYLAARKIQDRKDAFKASFDAVKQGLTREEKKQKKEAEKKHQFRLMLVCLLFNLGILAVIKYTNFTISNINGILHAFGSEKTLSFVNLVIPMGISFYTFQSLGYLIDVYQGKIKAERSLGKFALFVSFFPQLVQGPISRYSDLAESLYTEHKADYRTITLGLERILWGFFKKLVIADRMLVAVNAIIKDTETYNGAFAFVGMLFYALELYADFTGGIDITIGTAQTLGITVTENFNRPYFSKSIKEYWKRWHITMGTWFTDYIFYPLSICKSMQKLSKFSRKHFGEQIGKRIPVYLASFIVWFTTGIWHGANWNFIAWGIGNFVVIMISQELEPLYYRFHSRFRVQGKTWFKMFQVVRTVLIMSCLRMFDCYRDVPLTFKMFGSMFTKFSVKSLTGAAFLGLGLTVWDYAILLVGALLLFTVSMLGRSGSVREKIAGFAFPVRFLIWYGLFLTVLVFGAYGIGYSASQFIYNQF